jgi:hypothetical protein
MGRRALTIVAVTAMAALVLSAGAAGAGHGAQWNEEQSGRPSPSLQGEGEGLELVANIPYRGGSDMEFARIRGRDYAFTGSLNAEDGGLRVIDVTNPRRPRQVAHLPCVLNQNDIQISHDKKTVMMAADSPGGANSCLAAGRRGFMTVDIRNPRRPRPIGFAEIPRGSHTITAHPTKPYVYNSDSELTVPGQMQIWSIRNPRRPELVNTVPSLPHSPHDLGFNKDGTMAVTAAISHWDIWDTSDVENPELLWTGQCPGCQITHDAKFTPDGSHIFVGDEAAGGLPYPCPGGALYAYMLEGSDDRPVPVLTGIYWPGNLVTAQGGVGACTSHVFDISPDSSKLAISWYRLGTRYLDISEPHGLTFGPFGIGIQEQGWFIPEGANSWASKIHRGPWVYSNDLNRGFDVYRVVDN